MRSRLWGMRRACWCSHLRRSCSPFRAGKCGSPRRRAAGCDGGWLGGGGVAGYIAEGVDDEFSAAPEDQEITVGLVQMKVGGLFVGFD